MGELRVGQGIDVHPFADADVGAARPLVLAGVHVPGSPGLAGHSDADVVAHAVTDALLGAVAAGDLGSRFGVDDPAVAGADSLGLLGAVVADLAADGWHVGNVDCTVLAQRPRLAPHREAMRANLARVLGVELGAVSVKATTTDHLGAIGRAEGVACTAVCTVVR